MLTVAWNLADSGEMAYNYGQRTCGVQPLVTFVYAGFALLVKLFGGNKWILIRVVLFFGIINLLIFAFLVRKIMTLLFYTAEPGIKNLAADLAFILTLFNFQLFRLFSYGLETGIYLTTFACCILYSMAFGQFQKVGMQRAAAFGVLGGVTILARIDFTFVFAVVLFIALVRGQMELKETIISFLVGFVIQVPWLVHVHSIMGTYIQSSAYAQTRFIQVHDLTPRLKEMTLSILSHFTPWIYSYAHEVLSMAAFSSIILIVILSFLKGRVYAALVTVLKDNKWYANWVAAIVLLVFVYLMFSEPTHFYTRYISPFVLVALPLVAVTLAKLVQGFSPSKKCVLEWVLVTAFLFWCLLGFHLGRTGNMHSVSAGFVRDHFPAPYKVGAFQAGVIGFFNSNVINLDGKMDKVALKYKKNGELNKYVDKVSINVLIDWRPMIEQYCTPEWVAANWSDCSLKVPNGGTVCLMRKHSPQHRENQPGWH
jgi:hypothetical protein